MSSNASSVLRVRVKPGAKRDALSWDAARGWRVDVAAPPVDGKANERLCTFLGKQVLGIGAGGVRVRAGTGSREKLLDVDLPADALHTALLAAAAG